MKVVIQRGCVGLGWVQSFELCCVGVSSGENRELYCFDVNVCFGFLLLVVHVCL